MTAVLRTSNPPKSLMTVQPVNWLPGSWSAALPFFAMDANGKLFFRADDPNLYGVTFEGVTQSPSVMVDNLRKNTNKGYNFYSAPWSIPNLTAKDIGHRCAVTDIDTSIFEYIAALYALVGIDPQNPTNNYIELDLFQIEKLGYVKRYQIMGGNRYTNRNGTIYFGGANDAYTDVCGVAEESTVLSPLISSDFTYNGAQITTIQMPYNTFYVIDTPIVISALDTNNPSTGRIYFTLQNQVTMLNTSPYST